MRADFWPRNWGPEARASITSWLICHCFADVMSYMLQRKVSLQELAAKHPNQSTSSIGGYNQYSIQGTMHFSTNHPVTWSSADRSFSAAYRLWNSPSPSTTSRSSVTQKLNYKPNSLRQHTLSRTVQCHHCFFDSHDFHTAQIRFRLKIRITKQSQR